LAGLLKDHAVAASHHDATLNKRGPVVHHVRGLNCPDALRSTSACRRGPMAPT